MLKPVPGARRLEVGYSNQKCLYEGYKVLEICSILERAGPEQGSSTAGYSAVLRASTSATIRFTKCNMAGWTCPASFRIHLPTHQSQQLASIRK